MDANCSDGNDEILINKNQKQSLQKNDFGRLR